MVNFAPVVIDVGHVSKVILMPAFEPIKTCPRVS